MNAAMPIMQTLGACDFYRLGIDPAFKRVPDDRPRVIFSLPTNLPLPRGLEVPGLTDFPLADRYPVLLSAPQLPQSV